MYQSFAMPSIVKILRAVAEPNRLRLLLLLRGEELSVAEMQEILAMGQSTISTHLSQLKQAGLVEDRRAGKSSLYRLTTSGGGGVLDQILAEAKGEIPEAAGDQAAIRSVVRKRQDKMRSFFDSVAGRLGKDYVPGQSWKGVAEALLRLMPPMVVADLGAGEGAFALLLAQSAKKVIAVDTSAKMIEVGREQALRHGVKNVEYRLGDMEGFPSMTPRPIWSSSPSPSITRCIPSEPFRRHGASSGMGDASPSSIWSSTVLRRRASYTPTNGSASVGRSWKPCWRKRASRKCRLRSFTKRLRIRSFRPCLPSRRSRGPNGTHPPQAQPVSPHCHLPQLARAGMPWRASSRRDRRNTPFPFPIS